jgi:hypothetical protein
MSKEEIIRQQGSRIVRDHWRTASIRAPEIRAPRIRMPEIDFDTPAIPIRAPRIRFPEIEIPDIRTAELDSLLPTTKAEAETTVEVKRHGRSVGLAVVPERFVRVVFLSNVARPIDPAHVMILEIGLKFLPFIVPKKLRDAVTGDLTEEFRTYAARWGRSYALRWLWWELAGLCIRRFGPTAIGTGIAAWVRQKLGL